MSSTSRTQYTHLRLRQETLQRRAHQAYLNSSIVVPDEGRLVETGTLVELYGALVADLYMEINLQIEGASGFEHVVLRLRRACVHQDLRCHCSCVPMNSFSLASCQVFIHLRAVPWSRAKPINVCVFV